MCPARPWFTPVLAATLEMGGDNESSADKLIEATDRDATPDLRLWP
jgi:hypothetical protein